MEKKQDLLAELAKTLVFSTGISAGGKGVLAAITEDFGREKGVNVTSIATGTLFRAAVDSMGRKDGKNTDPVVRDIAEVMLRGEFIQTLKEVAPKLEQGFCEHFKRVLKGEKSLFIVDGGLRRGLAQGRNGTPYEGRSIPPQVDQVAEAAMRGLKTAILSDASVIYGLLKSDPELFMQIVARDKVDYDSVRREGFGGEFANKVILGANHAVLEVSPEHAVILMRNRFYKAVADFENKVIEQGGSKDLDKFIGSLNEILLLTSDNFTLDDGKIVLDWESNAEFNFVSLDPKREEAASKRLSEIANEICTLEGVSHPPEGVSLNIETAVKQYVWANDLAVTVDIRGDDQGGREKRAKAFDETKEQVLKGELDISYEGDKINTLDLPPNIHVLQNNELSPSGYEALVKKSRGLASQMLQNLPNISIEGGMTKTETRVENWIGKDRLL